MDLTLSWDLFVLVFFGIIIAYSYIIGKHESVKIIVFTYIAIVAGQGAGNIIAELSKQSQPFLASFGLTVDITIFGSTKLLIFVATIVFLSVRGGFDVTYNNEAGLLVNIILTGMYGFVTAGLLLTTLLTFVSGSPLLDANLAQSPALRDIVVQSELMQLMVLHQDVWFSLPALLLIGVGIVSNKEPA